MMLRAVVAVAALLLRGAASLTSPPITLFSWKASPAETSAAPARAAAVREPSAAFEASPAAVPSRRLLRIGGVAVASYVIYALGSDVLNGLMVAGLGIPRSRSAEAFGPFVTLLGLVYSVILGQIYTYYFDRQGTIQDKLYAETQAARDLAEAVDAVSRRTRALRGARRDAALAVLQRHGERLLATGFSAEAAHDDQEDLRSLLSVVEALDAAAPGDAGMARVAASAYERAAAARVDRRSALCSELPPIQIQAFSVISYVLLAGWLLVDLGAPTFEAVLFAVLAACFSLIAAFVEDLGDPYSGAWTVDSARAEVAALVAAVRAKRAP